MNIYRHEFQVKAPIEQVAFFHHHAGTLKILTPPPLVVKLNHVEPLSEGSIVDFTIWLGPVPIHWKAIHSEVDLITGFKDTQIEGPFSSWEHRHSFKAIDTSTTSIRDEIQAKFSQQPYRAIVCMVIWINLRLLFAYRTWKTKQSLEQ